MIFILIIFKYIHIYSYGTDDHGRFVDQRCRIILYCISKFLYFEIMHKFQSKNADSNPIRKLEGMCALILNIITLLRFDRNIIVVNT